MPATNPEDVDALFFEAMNRKDLDAAMNLHEPEARWFQRSGEIITGSTGIRTALEGFLGITPTFTADIRVFANGDQDVAITRASWKMHGVGADGRPIAVSDESIEVVRRQPDGTWRFAIVAPA